MLDTMATSSCIYQSSTSDTSGRPSTCFHPSARWAERITREKRTDTKTCSRILLTPAERALYLTKFRRANLEALQRQAAQKAVLTLCKKQPICPHCGSANGVVKKSGPLKISHEPYRSTKVKDMKEEEKSKMATVVGENRGLAAALEKKQDDMNALKVYELFRKVSPEVSRSPDAPDARRRRLHAGNAGAYRQDCELLALHPDIGRPEDYLWWYVPVPPPCIRPSVASEAGMWVSSRTCESRRRADRQERGRLD